MTDKETVILQSPSGPCVVRRHEDLVIARGVPYARAPRFQPPEPEPVWSTARDCTPPATICPQLPSRLESVMGPVTKDRTCDENCLHLTIAAPAQAVEAPVMVFLHGGAFISGGGDLDCYLPVDLARQGIVCVNVTYRLGVLGYLMLPNIAPANLGLLDQRTALQWVQRNISSFGGDPSNITLVGQSAGADSIVCLLASHGTEGLFHRAILMSGPLRELRDRVPTCALLTQRAQSLLTADPRTMTVPELLDFQKKLLLDPVRAHIMLFGPALGQYPLPVESELEKRLSERLAHIPILVGWTTHDGRPFARMMGPLRTWYSTPALGDVLESLGTWFVTTSYFSGPSMALHRQAKAQAGGRSTTYSFEWYPPANPLQSSHCIDIAFVLGEKGAWQNAPMLAGKHSMADFERISRNLQHLWAEFIKGRRLREGHIVIDGGFECSENLWE